MGNRDGFKKHMVSIFKKILVGNEDIRDHNISLLVNLLDSMNDIEFEHFIVRLEKGEIVIPVIDPNGANAVDYDNNLKIIEELNIELYKHVIFTNGDVEEVSVNKYMILELPGKKPIQSIDKKRSIPKDVTTVNAYTAQVTNHSKSMSLTGPELPLMLANGMREAIRELVKYRGGDEGATVAINRLASLGYDISQEDLERYSSGPKVNSTLKQFLLGMHILPSIKEKKK